MVKIYKLHKYFALLAGGVLFLLALSGLFLNHKNFSFMYDITFQTDSKVLLQKEDRLFESFYRDHLDKEHLFVCGKRGIFEKKSSFTKVFNQQCLSLRVSENQFFAATSDGIYHYDKGVWKSFALKGRYISALSVDKEMIVAVIDKRSIVGLNFNAEVIKEMEHIEIDSALLKEDIKLSRFVRDVHYARGLFDGLGSLLVTDYAAAVLIFLASSGYLVFYWIRKKIRAKSVKKIVRMHASVFSLLAIIPLILLALSGVLLGHSKLFGKWMKSVNIEHAYLPPVYDSLHEDIFCIDYHNGVYKIGNRYGLYESRDLKNWTMVSKGLVYKMKYMGEKLYISGMGAPNRLYDGNHYVLFKNAPHMFKDINVIDETKMEFLAHHSDIDLPKFHSITLYTLILSLHDGSFFASWWVWINDVASLLLLVILITGVIRYLRRKKYFKTTLLKIKISNQPRR